MAKKLCIMICKAFEREIRDVIKTEKLKNVIVETYPSSEFHIRMSWNGIIKKIQTNNAETRIILLKGGCVVGLAPQPKELERFNYIQYNQCFDMFINKSIIDSYIKQGAYLLSPNWLESWRNHMKEYAFNKKRAQEVFKNSNTKLLLLDTGVYKNSLIHLREFAEFVGLPFEILPVGLDFFKLYLNKILLELQLKEIQNDSDNKQIGELLSSLNIDTEPSIIEEGKKEIILFLTIWDDKLGPTLQTYFPMEIKLPIPIKKVSFQLFSSVESIYGQNNVSEAQGILLNIDNIQKQGYIFFDAIADPNARGQERPFMIGVIAPKINYFESLRIKEIFKVISQKIKEGLDWEVKNHWEKISHILSTAII
ncbi:MAG: DUF1638 domain-containing protein [Promethearchaeota archaeon]